MYTRAVVTLGFFLLGGSLTLAGAQDTPAKPDNTKVNKRDRNKGEPTADQQKENTSDRQLAANIRRALVKDKSLSTYAHNVKVIVQGGAVTLKGPVHTDDEKKAVEAKAAEVAGGAKISNELTVKGDSAKKSKKTST
ncbi:MAG: BON domain-containing protein [Bryobacteraceae bacterium]